MGDHNGSDVPPKVIEELRQFDSATVSNAVEHFAARDPTTGFANNELRCLTPEVTAPMVGYALTAIPLVEGQPDAQEELSAAIAPSIRPPRRCADRVIPEEYRRSRSPSGTLELRRPCEVLNMNRCVQAVAIRERAIWPCSTICPSRLSPGRGIDLVPAGRLYDQQRQHGHCDQGRDHEQNATDDELHHPA